MYSDIVIKHRDIFGSQLIKKKNFFSYETKLKFTWLLWQREILDTKIKVNDYKCYIEGRNGEANCSGKDTLEEREKLRNKRNSRGTERNGRIII